MTGTKFRPVLCRIVRELLLPLVLAAGLLAGGALIPAWAVTAEDLCSDDAVRLTSAQPVLHDSRFPTDFDLSAHR